MTITEDRPVSEPEAPSGEAAAARAPVGRLAAVLGTGDHKVVGRLYVAAAFLFLLVAGVTGALIGAERVESDRLDVLGTESFRQVFTLHSIGAVFLFLLPLLLGIALCIVPLQVGASTVAFPRAAAASFWMFLVGGGILLAAYGINGGPYGGDANGVDLFLLALAVVVVALLVATASVVTTVLALRTTGMTVDRVPLFSWSMLVAGTIWLLSLAAVLALLVLLFVDHHYGVFVFGHNEAIYSRLAWVFQQPQLYAFAVPALGIVGDAVPVAVGAPLRQRAVFLGAIGFAGALGFGAWAQPWLAPDVTEQFLYVAVAFAILLPLAVMTGGVGDTVRRGKLTLSPPLLLSIAALLMLLAGAAVGAASAIEQLDLRSVEGVDTTAVTAQTHFVLLGATIAAVAGLHHWAPKLFGRTLRDGTGRATAVLLLLGTAVLALADGVSGVLDQIAGPSGQPAGELRDGVDALNIVALAGGGLVVLGLVAFAANVLGSLGGRGEREPVPDDPWGGHTLEWATASPPAFGNFAEPPSVASATPLLDQREAPADAGGGS